jgi:hypothetical protein
MAGLLAARVLAEFYKQVTVLGRDPLPPAGQHRKGVPHGRHLHGLHPRGREILDELFPDFTAEVTAAGAVCCDVLADGRWQLSGHQLKQRHAGLPALLASRPFLEGHVRERVFRLPNVRVLDGHSADGLEAARSELGVTGVRVSDADGKADVIEADLVVDASGRGSRAPRWFSELRELLADPDPTIRQAPTNSLRFVSKMTTANADLLLRAFTDSPAYTEHCDIAISALAERTSILPDSTIDACSKSVAGIGHELGDIRTRHPITAGDIITIILRLYLYVPETVSRPVTWYFL